MANYYDAQVDTAERFEDFLDIVEHNPLLWQNFSILSDEDDEAVEIWIDTWDWSGANLDLAKRDLIGLGEADGGGSLLAFWNDGTGKSIDEMPLVILGGEGEFPIVASNLRDMLLLMSTGEELYIDSHYASCQFGKCNEGLAAWLKQAYDLEPLASAEEGNSIIAKAVETYGDAFTAWAKEAIDPDFELTRATK